MSDTSALQSSYDKEQSIILTEDERSALLALLRIIEQEDAIFRYNQLKEYKKYNQFWHGIQYIFWDSSAQDWKVPTHETLAQVSSSREEVKFIYDYVINIF